MSEYFFFNADICVLTSLTIPSIILGVEFGSVRDFCMIACRCCTLESTSLARVVAFIMFTCACNC